MQPRYPDQILIADVISNVTRGLEFKFGQVSELALKGLPKVSARTIEWVPRDASDDVIPLPPSISPVPSFAVYGRADELAIIERSWG